MERKQGYILYRTWTPLILGLPDTEAGILFKAICKYQNGEAVTIENPMLNAVFQMIESTFKLDEERYAERCRQNAENGRKGGRPKNPTQPNETDRFSAEAKEPDIDMYMEIDIDKGIDKGMEMEMETDKGLGVQGEGEKEEPLAYGNYGNVYLNQSELDKLIDVFGAQQTQYAIDNLSYVNSKAKSPSKNGHFKKLFDYLHAETGKG